MYVVKDDLNIVVLAAKVATTTLKDDEHRDVGDGILEPPFMVLALLLCRQRGQSDLTRLAA